MCSVMRLRPSIYPGPPPFVGAGADARVRALARRGRGRQAKTDRGKKADARLGARPFLGRMVTSHTLFVPPGGRDFNHAATTSGS